MAFFLPVKSDSVTGLPPNVHRDILFISQQMQSWLLGKGQAKVSDCETKVCHKGSKSFCANMNEA